MRTNQRPQTTKRRVRRGSGFTMIEIMFAVLIMGILMGLLIGSVRLVTQMSKATVDRQTVHTIQMGTFQFKTQFGFQMPLVRDKEPGATSPTYGIFEAVPGVTPAQNRISVHSVRDANYLAYMQSPGPGVTANNPLADDRYSERSILIYLAGQFSVDLTASLPGLPIDGVAGAGFCKPLTDGSFAIPAGILHPATGAAATLRKGVTFDSFVALNSTAPKLAIDTVSIPLLPPGLNASVADRNGVPVRYYRWEPGSIPPPAPGNPIPLNIPLMVGRYSDAIPGYTPPDDRDMGLPATPRNPNIRAATFAIVAAGPDGVFGDEALDVLCGKLGVGYPTTLADEVKIRMKAEKDNIVEVGQ